MNLLKIMICGYLYTIKLFNIKITIFKYHIIFVEIFTYLYNILISYMVLLNALPLSRVGLIYLLSFDFYFIVNIN